MSLLHAELQKALTKIKSLFAAQCSGLAKQNNKIEQGEYCCGQFLGPAAATIPQRGIHGLASAIRVLAGDASGQTSQIVDGLVFSADKYVNQFPAELKTVKLAELLWACEKTKPTDKGNNVIVKLKKLLESAKQNNGQFGWPFLINPAVPKKGDVHLLPTIYVFRALWDSSNTGPTEDVLDYIEGSIETYFKSNPQKSDVELYTIIFALYIISLRRPELSRNEEDKYTSYLKKLIHRVGATIREDSEQNIEYWDDNRSYYLRIPWQLYLFSLIARFRPHYLYRDSYKMRLTQICARIADGEFIYPYAGRLLSSRTHAIAFECLEQIDNDLQAIPLRNQILYSVRGWLVHKIVKWVIATFLFVFIAIAYYRGMKSEGLDLKGLATELNGSLISFAFLWCLGVFNWLKRSS